MLMYCIKRNVWIAGQDSIAAAAAMQATGTTEEISIKCMKKDVPFRRNDWNARSISVAGNNRMKIGLKKTPKRVSFLLFV